HVPSWAARTVAALAAGDPTPRWLLVFDGVEPTVDLTPYLPGGGGHVLLTARGPRPGTDVPLPVDLDQDERVELLHRAVPTLPAPVPGSVAARLANRTAVVAVLGAWRAALGGDPDPELVEAAAAADDPMVAACRRLLAAMSADPAVAALLLRCA